MGGQKFLILHPNNPPHKHIPKVGSAMWSSATPGPDSAVVAGFPHGLPPRQMCARSRGIVKTFLLWSPRGPHATEP